MRVAFEKQLLVDGANILHAWPEFQSLLKRERDTARGLLAQRLSAIHDFENVRVTIVHDGRGSELTIERPSQQETFSIIYTPSSLTADDVIERLVGKSAQPTECVVASADRALRQTIEALGAIWMSPDDLAAWAVRAAQQQTRHIDRLRSSAEKEWRRDG